LRLAALAIVALKAFARAGGVVAKTASRAVHALCASICSKNIWAGRALTRAAIRSAVVLVALASILLVSIIRSVAIDVKSETIRSKSKLRLANTVSRAIVWANRSLASNSCVSREAIALSASIITSSATRALNVLMRRVRVRAVEGVSFVIGEGEGILVASRDLAPFRLKRWSVSFLIVPNDIHTGRVILI